MAEGNGPAQDGPRGSARTRSPASSATAAPWSSVSPASSTSTTRTTLREALLECCGEAPERLVVDLSEVKFIDSTALGVLIEARTRLPNRRGFLLAAPGLETRRALEISGLDRHFAVHASLDDALAARRASTQLRGPALLEPEPAPALRRRDRQGVARRQKGDVLLVQGEPRAPRAASSPSPRPAIAPAPTVVDVAYYDPLADARAARARDDDGARRRHAVGAAPHARARQAARRARAIIGDERARLPRRHPAEAHRDRRRARREADDVLPAREPRPAARAGRAPAGRPTTGPARSIPS